MNPDRLGTLFRQRAALLAELARLDGEIAAELLGAQPANEQAPPTSSVTPSPKRPRGPRIPSGIVVSDLDRARATKAARKKGMLP